MVMRRGRLGWLVSDGEATQLVEAGFVEPDGELVDLGGLIPESDRLDHPDDEREVIA